MVWLFGAVLCYPLAVNRCVFENGFFLNSSFRVFGYSQLLFFTVKSFGLRCFLFPAVIVRCKRYAIKKQRCITVIAIQKIVVTLLAQ